MRREPSSRQRETHKTLRLRGARQGCPVCPQRDLALGAARLWLKLDPSADRAKQMVATLSQPGAGGDIKAELERVLAEAGVDSKTLADDSCS